MAEPNLKAILDSFDHVRPLVVSFNSDGSDNVVSLKDRMVADKWFDSLCDLYCKNTADVRAKIRAYFQEQDRAWALLEYIDRLLARCVPSNAERLLRKALVILSIENQNEDFREFDTRAEIIWNLAIQAWGTGEKLFGDAVKLADFQPSAYRNWSKLDCFKHWQRRKP